MMQHCLNNAFPMCRPHKLLQQLNGQKNIFAHATTAFKGFQGCGHYFCFMCTFIWANEAILAPHFDMFMSITLLQIVLLGLEGLYMLR